MNWTKSVCAIATATAIGLGTVGAAPAEAAPAPYTPQPTVTVSKTNPGRGATITIKGAKFKPREQIVVKIRSKAETLKTFKANRKGGFTSKITIPRKYKCEHTLVVRGKSSKLVVLTQLFIGKRRACR
ncbi:hypothetical protein [Sporichthya polymorpha]|uniref:hypothetical protein n=1 Tax=Sporichthya polymorpha TaxID=35751 RepID=UPI000372673C|nr:hypothetical protein [Sporichthya polymorpha]